MKRCGKGRLFHSTVNRRKVDGLAGIMQSKYIKAAGEAEKTGSVKAKNTYCQSSML